MFFVRTKERTITREELLERPRHREYLTSITCAGENGEREYLSGVSTIQKKWDPKELHVDDTDTSPEPVEIIKNILMVKAGELVNDPKDFAVICRIIEEADEYCTSKPDEEGNSFASRISNYMREKLQKLYRQEYCRLLWNGNILYAVEAEPWASKPSARLKITSGVELKCEAQERFFGGYENLSWNNVSSVFRLKMRRFPETMAIINLREYFEAMAELLQAKTVFESDLFESPFSPVDGMYYDVTAINNRVGTELVEVVQRFGGDLGMNRCYRAASELERIQQLQTESVKITDQTVRRLTEEALGVLKSNIDILQKYFDIWDAYIEEIICGNPGADAYEYDGCSDTEMGKMDDPWLKAESCKRVENECALWEESETYTDEELLEFLQEGVKRLWEESGTYMEEETLDLL